MLELEHVVYHSQPSVLPADHTSVSPLSTAATVGIAVSGTVIFVVALLLVVTFLLARKHSYSKQIAGELYEIPLNAIGMKENEAYGTNTQTHQIATAANEAYGRVGDIPVAENVAYIPAAVNIPTVQNEAYGGMGGAAVNTDTIREEMYDYVKN